MVCRCHNHPASPPRDLLQWWRRWRMFFCQGNSNTIHRKLRRYRHFTLHFSTIAQKNDGHFDDLEQGNVPLASVHGCDQMDIGTRGLGRLRTYSYMEPYQEDDVIAEHGNDTYANYETYLRRRLVTVMSCMRLFVCQSCPARLLYQNWNEITTST